MLPKLFLLATPLAVTAATNAEPRALMVQALANMKQGNEKLSDYTFERRTERIEFSPNHTVKTRTTSTIKREEQEGFLVSRLIEHNGKAPSEEERRLSEAAIQKRLAELKAMTPEQRKQLQDTNRRRRGYEDAWLDEFPEALDYKPAGEENIHGARHSCLSVRRSRVTAPGTCAPGYSRKRAVAFGSTKGIPNW